MNDLWIALTNRLSWPVLNRVLHLKGLPTARGREKTFEKLRLLCDSNVSMSQSFSELKNELLAAVLYKDKYVKYFDVDASTINSVLSHLRQRFSGFQAQNALLGKRFPQPDTVDSIRNVPNSPELIQFIESENSISLVYSTVRKIRQREDLLDRLGGIDGAAFVNEFTSVYGIRVEPIQFFDVVHFDSARGMIEVRLDNSREVTHGILEENYKQIVSEVQSIVYAFNTINLGRPHNFYSVLRNLYEDSNQGRVKEMAFITDTRSLKHERKNYEDGLDLRKEPYHENGKSAIGAMDFYRLGVSWEKSEPLFSTIYLQILGLQHMLNHEKGPYINTAFIRGCHSAKEYSFVLDILRDYE